MGKKNKHKKDENAGDNKSVQQQNQPQGASQPPGPSGNQSGPQQSRQAPQQQQQQGTGRQQHSDPPPQHGGWAQQQSGQRQQQRGPLPQQQQSGQSQPQQQQGAWGQQQQGAWGQQHSGPAPQHGGRAQQQSGQRQQQRGPPPQQQQSGQSQPQQQQGAWGQQHSGPPPQHGGRAQQQSGQRQQQKGPPPQQQKRGQSQPQQQQQSGPAQQQQGGWRGPQQSSQGHQQRGPPQQSSQGHQQRGPPQQRGRDPRQQQQGVQQQSTERSFQQLSISDEQVLPVKQKSCAGLVRGTLGRPGVLEVNYVKLNLDGMPKEAYHYDVAIEPDRPKKFLRSAFEQCKREMFGNIEAAFDGNKSCYSVSPLPTPINHKVMVPDSGNRMKEFNVQIKETLDAVVDLDSLRRYHNEKISDKPMRAIQALDVVLAGNNHERAIRVGRSFFRRPDNPFDLENGFEAWTGLFQAAILGEQPFLNVDIAHKSFPRKSSLLEYLGNQNIRLDQNLDNYSMKDFQRFINGLNIEYEPPVSFGAHPKRYKVLDVGDSASRIKFKNDDGKEMTVSEYFRSRGSPLRYPNLNCLKVGSTVRSIYLPMEFCSIPEGQVLNRKDDKRQVEKMIRFAATSTNKRKEKIMDMLHYFQHNSCPLLRAFGVQIGTNFIKVPMRLLPAPFMEYLNGQTVTTSRGAWRMDGKLFLNTSKTPNGHKWAILYEPSRNNRGISYHELEAFKKDVFKTSQSLGMNLAADAEIVDYGRNQLQNTLDSFARKNIALVFVVLGNFGTSYAQIKQAAELKVGILTQCIKENTVRRTGRDRTVFSNILLKVNAKLNGTNHKISKDREQDLQRLMDPIKKVMFIGADVTHPSPDQRHIPSVVGVAASHDLFGACYNMQYRLQKSTQEEIDDMEAIATCHLKIFHKYQNCYPDQIIYYRDGVSDGQFPKVRDIELRSIRNACARLKINPKLTCVIVVKRHHTRFFPMTKPRDDRDFNNVEPGTVVDQHITHPNEVQFFMVSHQSIQGTAKPTRYNVIVDDSNFDINLLQKLTYNLCHLFPRCNRPVSYPAPAYLAHLVAFRGRVYLEGSYKFTNNYKKEYESRLIKPEFMVRNPMYFV